LRRSSFGQKSRRASALANSVMQPRVWPDCAWVATLAAGSEAIANGGFGDDMVLISGVFLHGGPVAVTRRCRGRRWRGC